MLAIASLIQDDPYLRTPKEERIAERMRRRELFRRHIPVVVQPIAPDPIPDPEPAPVSEPKPLWFSVDADLGPITAKAILIEDIIRVVCKYFDISKQDILSARRTTRIVLPRQVCAYLARTLTLRSLPAVGRALGRRDHSTICHAVHKISDLIQKDQAFAARINILSRQVLNVD